MKITKFQKAKLRSKKIANRIMELKIFDFIENLPGEGQTSFSLTFESNWLYNEQSFRGKGEQAPECNNETCSNL